jgi:hypothetical protein
MTMKTKEQILHFWGQYSVYGYCVGIVFQVYGIIYWKLEVSLVASFVIGAIDIFYQKTKT